MKFLATMKERNHFDVNLSYVNADRFNQEGLGLVESAQPLQIQFERSNDLWQR